MENRQVLVIGESCLDIFVYGEAHRLAPDLPIPILTDCVEVRNPGMAANVTKNLEALGLEVDLVTNSNWRDVTKTRFVHSSSNHTFLRVDRQDKILPLRRIPNLDKYGTVIISDYDKGFLPEPLVEDIIDAHRNVIIDTKKILGPWVSNARLIKINAYEFSKSHGFIDESIESKIIKTRGEFGAEYQEVAYEVQKVDARDTSGAGDAFLASLVHGLTLGGDVPSAIRLANFRASETVKNRGVTIVAP